MKAVPDMLSVLLTTASEDVAHLLGGVDLALFSLHSSSRKVPGVGSGARLSGPLHGSRGCSPFDAYVSSALSLLVVPSNIMPGVFTLPQSPYKVYSPCTVLVGGSWEPGCAFRWLRQHKRGIVVGEPWFAPLPPPLVPTSLA